MRFERVLILTIALWLASVAAHAQVPGMWPWWDGPIAKDLGLTEDQNKRIRETVRASRDRLIELRGAVESAEAALKDEMNEEKVDTRKAEAAIDRVVNTRSELTRVVSQMSLKLRLILTSEQWSELQKREVRPPGPRPQGPGMQGPNRPFRPPGSEEPDPRGSGPPIPPSSGSTGDTGRGSG